MIPLGLYIIALATMISLAFRFQREKRAKTIIFGLPLDAAASLTVASLLSILTLLGQTNNIQSTRAVHKVILLTTVWTAIITAEYVGMIQFPAARGLVYSAQPRKDVTSCLYGVLRDASVIVLSGHPKRGNLQATTPPPEMAAPPSHSSARPSPHPNRRRPRNHRLAGRPARVKPQKPLQRPGQP